MINYFKNHFSTTNKTIIFLRNQHEKKIIFCSSASNQNDELRHKTKVNHEMKEIVNSINDKTHSDIA